MVSTIKTTVTADSPENFIASVEPETRKRDGFTLLDVYKKITGEPPKMWGPSIIGFGQYHYKSERSKQEGDWPLVGFSPRKQNLTLYFMLGFDAYTDLLKQLGKHRLSKGCLYINKLADVDLKVLEALIRQSYADMKNKYRVSG